MIRFFKHFAVATCLAVGFAAGIPSSGSAAPTSFGSDLAGVPDTGLFTGGTHANAAGGPGATPAGYVVPADGVITGWRMKAAGPGTSLVRFQVIRGTTSIYLGPVVDVGPADGISATFPESVLVRPGDKIGVTHAGAPGPRLFITTVGGTMEAWVPALGASETSPPDATFPGFTLLIQADLDSALAICGGANVTIAGTPASETIVGTPGNDVIAALGGNDRVFGLGGNDIICGGDGNDTLKGGAGKDRLFGDAGRDKLRGGTGRDRCAGGPGRDSARSC